MNTDNDGKVKETHFLDMEGITIMTAEERKAISGGAVLGQGCIDKETGEDMVFDGSQWVYIGELIREALPELIAGCTFLGPCKTNSGNGDE